MSFQELLDDVLRCGVVDDVAILEGVLLQVEELARSHGILVDHQLVTVRLERGKAPVLADR